MEDMKKSDVEQMAREYLGATLRDVKVTMMGQVVDLEVTWLDGPPTGDVRRWADRNIPLLNNVHLERIYSDHAVATALMELYDSDMEVGNRVEEYLCTKNLETSEA